MAAGAGAATRASRLRLYSATRRGYSTEVLFRVPRQDLTVGQGRVLAKDFELEVPAGSRWAIVGPNGCGKSTASRLIGSGFCGVTPTAPSGVDVGGGGGDGDAFASIAFESHRSLLAEELREYRESRADVTRLRATLASYIFPHLSPEDPNFSGGFRSTSKDGTRVGFRPDPTRLAPLAVPYDADAEEPLLAELEAAVTSGEAGRLLEAFGLGDVRRRPTHAMCSHSRGREYPCVSIAVTTRTRACSSMRHRCATGRSTPCRRERRARCC